MATREIATTAQKQVAISTRPSKQLQAFLVMKLTYLAQCRQAAADPAILELFSKELSKYDQRDISKAVDYLAHTRRQDGETAFPDLPTLEDAIKQAELHRVSQERAEEKRQKQLAEERDRKENPGNYFHFAELIADVMKRKGIEAAEIRKNKAAEESTAKCPHCGETLILSGATLTHLSPADLRALADVMERM